MDSQEGDVSALSADIKTVAVHGASQVSEILSAHVIHVFALEGVVVDSLSYKSNSNYTYRLDYT